MMKNKGIIAINKSENWTSFDVVNKIKHILHIRQVGHLGTLDPMATGVLLVTVGKATKLFDLMQEKVKVYDAEFEFGYSTDTLDSTGKVIDRTTKIPTIDEIQDNLHKFIGKIEQIPPKYSAKNVNGARAYDLARSGVEFELKPKQVEIFKIELISYYANILKLEITCGSGTYIRAIGRDIAQELNSLATMTRLVRTKVGDVSLENCQKIDEFSSENIDSYIKPISEILNLPTIEFDDIQTKKILNGQTLIIEKEDGIYQLKDEIDTIAIVRVEKNKAKMSLFMA